VSWDVVAAVLAAAVLHAVWNALIRGRAGDAGVASTGLSVTWAVLGWPLALAQGALPPDAIPSVCASAVIHVVYFALLTLAYREGELSLVYPIARGVPPVLVALGSAAVVGETVALPGVVGIGLVAAGVLLLGPRGRAGGRAVALALGCAACTAAYTLVDGLGVRAAGDAFAYTSWLVALQGTLFAAGATALGGRSFAWKVWEGRRVALISGILAALGYGAALWGMTSAPVAAVAALRETSVLFAVLLGAGFLGEPLGTRRALGAAVVVIGAIGLRFA
jgi:drug/metabolite transporter (DMT)-like permease